jgi:hypothetical protein
MRFKPVLDRLRWSRLVKGASTATLMVSMGTLDRSTDTTVLSDTFGKMWSGNKDTSLLLASDTCRRLGKAMNDPAVTLVRKLFFTSKVRRFDKRGTTVREMSVRLQLARERNTSMVLL